MLRSKLISDKIIQESVTGKPSLSYVTQHRSTPSGIPGNINALTTSIHPSLHPREPFPPRSCRPQAKERAKRRAGEGRLEATQIYTSDDREAETPARRQLLPSPIPHFPPPT